MNNIDNLYRQVIMEHHKNPRNKGLKEGSEYHTLHLKNPSCGDDIYIQVKFNNDTLQEVRHNGTGCSICCSSASVMTEVLKGKTIKEASEIIEDFYELIKGNLPSDEDRLEEAIVYINIHNFPPRAKCATLSWRALGALLIGDEGEQEDE